MSVAQQAIDVDVPASVAYDWWARFEELPRFMEGVVRVRPQGGDRLTWTAEICGQEVAWQARITDRVRNKKLGWKSDEGLFSAGTVVFEPLATDRTRVTVCLEYDPDDVARLVGSRLGPNNEEVRGDLECFKELVEDAEQEVHAK